MSPDPLSMSALLSGAVLWGKRAAQIRPDAGEAAHSGQNSYDRLEWRGPGRATQPRALPPVIPPPFKRNPPWPVQVPRGGFREQCACRSRRDPDPYTSGPAAAAAHGRRTRASELSTDRQR